MPQLGEYLVAAFARAGLVPKAQVSDILREARLGA
jgi:hypothetical protein